MQDEASILRVYKMGTSPTTHHPPPTTLGTQPWISRVRAAPWAARAGGSAWPCRRRAQRPEDMDESWMTIIRWAPHRMDGYGLHSIAQHQSAPDQHPSSTAPVSTRAAPEQHGHAADHIPRHAGGGTRAKRLDTAVEVAVPGRWRRHGRQRRRPEGKSSGASSGES